MLQATFQALHISHCSETFTIFSLLYFRYKNLLIAYINVLNFFAHFLKHVAKNNSIYHQRMQFPLGVLNVKYATRLKC